jgi:DNA-binding transcriptional LysR family regulator
MSINLRISGLSPSRHSPGFFQFSMKERVRKSPKVWSSESPYLILDLVLSGLGWAELPWTVVVEKLESGELIRPSYGFQQTDNIHGVDVV